MALRAIKLSLKAEPNNASVWQKYGELLCVSEDCETGLKWLLKARHSDATLPKVDYDIALTDLKLIDLNGPHSMPRARLNPSPMMFPHCNCLPTWM